jgi:hypothetical protein
MLIRTAVPVQQELIESADLVTLQGRGDRRFSEKMLTSILRVSVCRTRSMASAARALSHQ